MSTGTAREAPVCPACGLAPAEEPCYRVEGFAILRCRRCGLGRTELPADFDPLRQYDEGYFQGARADGYADYPGSERVLRREFRAGLQHLLRHGPSSGKLLEVGCAYGYFLEEARARFTVCGVEPAEGAAAAARARGLDVASGTAHPEFLATRGPFDAFVLLDVIEHVACPGELLLTLARHARPGAALLLSTGDWGSLSARLLGRRWRLMTPPQHLWFFTRAALQRLLARAGFSVLDVRHPWKRVPLELIAYQLGRSLGLQPALQRVPWPDLGLPLNLFDALRLVARYTGLAEPESRGAPPTAPGQ